MRWRKLLNSLLNFGIAIAFATVTFYKLTNETGTDGMMLWRQVETQSIGFIFTILFILKGIIDFTEVIDNESK